MKRLLLLVAPLLALAAFQALAQGGPLAPVKTAGTSSEPYNLRWDNDSLVYCDKRGGRALNLQTAQDTAHEAVCTPVAEPNTACSGFGIDVEVRAPLSTPNDIVDVKGVAVPVKGRVRDCSADAQSIAVATGSSVVLIEVATAKAVPVDRQGGERVLLGPKWMAWSNGEELHWRQRRPE
jgi:hypothetical protein